MADEKDWGLQLSFWIDTAGYNSRDKNMFVAGFEFAQIVAAMGSKEGVRRPIHRENESRARMLAGKFKRHVQITPCEGFDDWSELILTPVE